MSLRKFFSRTALADSPDDSPNQVRSRTSLQARYVANALKQDQVNAGWTEATER